ncbi:hypothetical protein GPL21_13270 [Bradyrhizobium pachyrhizi]|uniref:Uncharacterized protein n=1 Tax=Bradyrhizobium pachyrhizi TaxID=280333 RepID=A0A844SJS0_9BRAD|nr:hypothetical protein [Bradyrhizobium pachyrhizi]MVT66077.1 hypothetical protein [Bradyrhizobium pachyrhizi]
MRDEGVVGRDWVPSLSPKNAFYADLLSDGPKTLGERGLTDVENLHRLPQAALQ